MERLLLFGDANLLSSKLLFKETLHILRRRSDICLAGVVDTARSEPQPRSRKVFQPLAARIAIRACNYREKLPVGNLSTVNLYDLCRKADIEVIVPKDRNVNSQDFLDFLKETVRPTLGLSIGCLQIFRKPLRDCFEVFVNYHNGLLPQYGGLHATAWSLYHNEKETGYTYHHIHETIDGGNILLQGSIQVSEGTHPSDAEHEKTVRASKDLESVMEMMLGRNPGIAQQGPVTYFGKKEYETVTTINDISQVTYEEILKRLRSFRVLRLTIDGRQYGVTRFKTIVGGKRSGSTNDFVTQDNIVIRPIRVSWLPVHLYEMYQVMQRL